MARSKRPFLLGMLAATCLLVGCDRAPSGQPAAGTARASNQTGARRETTSDSNAADRARLREALAHARKVREERLRGDPRQMPLPNFPTGPGRPRPTGVNFYQIDDAYPGYLLCLYDVEEQRYDPRQEAAWFQSAIAQIRDLGPQRFPAFDWVAVVIRNRAEHTGMSTFQQSHRAGAIFRASDVFGSAPEALVASALIDRRPFTYDPQAPEERRQQWTLVERHQASTRPAGGSK